MSVTESAPRPSSTSVSTDTSSSFRHFYSLEAPFLFRVVRRLGGPTNDLEDLVHDVFAIAFRNWGTVDLTRPMRPWLYGIAVRVLLDKHRKASTHAEIPHPTVPESADVRANPLEAAEQRQGLSLAQAIILELELERRVVFVLHELEGLTMPEIAAQLGIPLNTAYSRLRLARRDFDELVKARTETQRGN